MQPAATATNPLITLLDLVDSPLLLFNPEGQVVFTNRAAKRMEARPGMALPGDPNVRQLVQQIAQNKSVLRLDMVVEVNTDQGTTELLCQCIPKPIAGLVAMAVSLAPSSAVVTQTSCANGAAPERLSLQQIVGLIAGDLIKPIQAVLEHTQLVSATHPSFAEAVQTLHQRLERLGDLVAVFGEDVLIGDERILMPDIVRAVCQSLTPLARAKGVAFILEGDREDLPPVYGSRKLILRALQECLGNAVSHARPPTQANQSAGIRVGFTSSGHHLILNVANLGVLDAQALTRQSESIFRAAPMSNGHETSDTTPAAVMQIGLPLTHRILELHGGRLRIENDNGEVDVMLELPTGAPLKNTHHLDLLQAQIYAEDLSTLMARSRSRSTT